MFSLTMAIVIWINSCFDFRWYRDSHFWFARSIRKPHRSDYFRCESNTTKKLLPSTYREYVAHFFTIWSCSPIFLGIISCSKTCSQTVATSFPNSVLENILHHIILRVVTKCSSDHNQQLGQIFGLFVIVYPFLDIVMLQSKGKLDGSHRMTYV